MKKIVVLGLLISFLFSCSILSVDKRRYRKGFHVSWNKNIQKSEPLEKGEKIVQQELVASNDQTTESSSSGRMKSTLKVRSEVVLAKDEKRNSIKKSRIVYYKSRKEVAKKQNVYKVISKNQKKTKTKVRCLEQKEQQTSALYYFLLSGIVPFIALQRKRGYTAAKWASENKLKAQGALALGSFAAVFSSFFLGNILQWETSGAMLLAPASLMTAGLLINAQKHKGNRLLKNRLSISLLNIGTTFGGFFAGANIPSLLSVPGEVDDPTILNPAGVFALTILLIVFIAAGLYLVAILSCSIACGGSGILALVVLFGGSYLVLFLGLLGFANVYRRESQKGESMIGKSALRALIGIIIIAIAILILSSL